MIAGIGIDLIQIDRIKRAIEKWGEPFLDRVFTKEEKSYSFSQGRPYPHLAARFGAKEAFLKAIGTGMGKGIRWKDIEVIRNNEGRPGIKLYGSLKGIASERRIIDILVSISHEKDYAIAQVILVSEKNR